MTVLMNKNTLYLNSKRFKSLFYSILVLTLTVMPSMADEYGFTGQRYESESGLLYLRARYYDPDSGRFLTKDPLGVSAGPNAYIYVGNSPINFTDPLGLFFKNIDWFKPGDEDFQMGRDLDWKLWPFGTDNPLMNTTEIYFPGAHQFAQIHDPSVKILTDAGVPDLLANVPTMAPAYVASIVVNTVDTVIDTAISGASVIDGVGDFIEGTGSFFKDIGTSIGNFFGFGDNTATDVGGVLINKAAKLVGSNLSDLRGAMYDPKSGQFVFLGTAGSEAVKDIDLDYLYTALNAVYGSAVPPSVTLDPPASAYTKWTDLGDGDGIFEPDEKGGFLVRYNPIWSEEDTTVDITINAEWSGTDYEWVARFECVPLDGPISIKAGDRYAMVMVFDHWIEAPPSGVSLDTSAWVEGIPGGSFYLTPDSQDSFKRFTMLNGTPGNFLVNSVRVVPARQHRKFGGRVENTRLGWVMLEADRVMKCLSVGRDNLRTNVLYNSATVSVPSYQNMTERGGTGNIRMWFTPNEMTLKRHVDSESGRASIVFDEASVALNTESFMMGLPQPPEARDFSDHFTANYDAFAELEFPCVDPDDPDGTNIVQVKIFDQLRDAMQAVSLARFFRDNDVPVDLWWLNSWEPKVAHSPRSAQTAYNEENGMIIYGGVNVNKPNRYVPSVTTESVADGVLSSRPSIPDNPNEDIAEQVWSSSTVEGDLVAVATQTEAEEQDGNLRFTETDLTFASPGSLPLQFARFYQSGWLGSGAMGPGWRVVPFALEFERPSWVDEHEQMKDLFGEPLWSDSMKDTRLRSGRVRVVDLSRGGVLDFSSSLVLGYTVDNIGNSVITVSGLDTNGLPTFAPGTRKSGATLTQLNDQRHYLFQTPGGFTLSFDDEGRLLYSEDRHGNRQTYTYEDDLLVRIADEAGQTLSLSYNTESNRIEHVIGPVGEQMTYTYTTNDCLERATHLRSGGYVQYAYNDECQLIGKQLYNGLDVLTASPDLRGRANETVDVRSNVLEKTFSMNESGTVRTTQIDDPRVNDPAFQPRQRQLDREGRLLASRDATGAETLYSYEAGSLSPNTIDLPIAGRPPIEIDRNEFQQPTRISDPGNLGAQDQTASYDAINRLLTHRTDSAGRSTQITYDANHNRTRVRRQLDGQNVDAAYSYSASGALHSLTNPLGIAITTIQRDAFDRGTNVIDATGVAIGYQYDALGRLWKIDDPRLSSPVEYIYDDFDRVLEIRYPVGSLTFEYDPVMGWLTAQTDILGRRSRTVRDPNTGDILQTIEEEVGQPDRVTEMSYNRFGQLASVTPPDAEPILFEYDDLGRPLGQSEVDALPPGAPPYIDSDAATDGVWTLATDHHFTWGAPASDSGIEGYSWALDAAPGTNVQLTSASVSVSNVSVGQHLFRVRARSHAGLWGEEGTFHLWVTNNTAPEIIEGEVLHVFMDQDGEKTPFELTLHASDAESDPITWSVSHSASNGVAVASGVGTEQEISYTPQSGYRGSDHFSVQISDGHGGIDAIAVNVTVLYPQWWIDRGVVTTNLVVHDHAAVNQGQLKWTASMAYEEFKAHLTNDLSAIHNLVSGFTTNHSCEALNLGQLKYVAQPFYDVLTPDHTNAWPIGMTVGPYPWSGVTNAVQNYAIGNLGQLKYVFSFDLTREKE